MWQTRKANRNRVRSFWFRGASFSAAKNSASLLIQVKTQPDAFPVGEGASLLFSSARAIVCDRLITTSVTSHGN